ncbi:hypothetical protein KOW79_004756 [Hemibagrus wyckioides]|uniref:C-type lectin domain-containing protein n=1 Tax=Hemibagrus wyckioides TaxID=337641 RepID=A0A9D3SNM0_9TELE|nr:hypothetical protein KOW79_004756 [Hemibagrus wyckioides]
MRRESVICSLMLYLGEKEEDLFEDCLEIKTWEEALQHCRNYYTCLAFVDSDKQLKYYETLLKMETQTDTVWTGLHFLDGKWVWVNGTLLRSLVPLPQFPIQPYRCGAYNSYTSVWENRDCNEELDFLCYL